MKTRWKGSRKAGIVCAITTACLLTSGCAETTSAGDAGCAAYGEARLSMPWEAELPESPWITWIADTDDRMTGVCT